MFRRSRPHLWLNPHTREYHDPAVLWDSLAGTPPPAAVREALRMPHVTPSGGGYAESQVREAHESFVAYLEKKGYKARA